MVLKTTTGVDFIFYLHLIILVCNLLKYGPH